MAPQVMDQKSENARAATVPINAFQREAAMFADLYQELPRVVIYYHHPPSAMPILQLQEYKIRRVEKWLNVLHVKSQVRSFFSIFLYRFIVGLYNFGYRFTIKDFEIFNF